MIHTLAYIPSGQCCHCKNCNRCEVASPYFLFIFTNYVDAATLFKAYLLADIFLGEVSGKAFALFLLFCFSGLKANARIWCT